MKILAALLIAALSVPAAAQGGGFAEGELFVYTNGLTSPGYTGAGILRVNPVTGASSILVQTHSCFDYVGTLAFDPYRQRLVFTTVIPGVDPSPKNYTWLADGAGNLQNLTATLLPNGSVLSSFAPTGDGRIYARSGNNAEPFAWLDAANGLHVLYDADGVTPFKVDADPFFPIEGMIYDPGTNALFVSSTKPKPGFPTMAVNVRKLPLSADGKRVVGPVGNAQFEVSSKPPGQSSGETPRGWSRGPGGQLILCILTIDQEVLPRLLQVDPVTMAISVWSNIGNLSNPLGESTNTGAAYTTALGKVVAYDYWNSKLRAYAQGFPGGSGEAIPLAPATLTGNGYYLNIVAVPPDDCSGGWIAHGDGLMGAGNVVPQLAGAGCPEPGAPFTLQATSVVGGAPGALFLGLAPGALPFKGGTLHLAGITLSVGLVAGGAPGVPGAGSVVLPSVLPNDALLHGVSLHFQSAWSDLAAVKKVSLSNGLEMEIG